MVRLPESVIRNTIVWAKLHSMMAIETSCPPYWCPRALKGPPCMLVFQTNRAGVELFFSVNSFFCSNKFE